MKYGGMAAQPGVVFAQIAVKTFQGKVILIVIVNWGFTKKIKSCKIE
jgi:hypothetical protein